MAYKKSIGTKMNDLDLCLEVVSGLVNRCITFATECTREWVYAFIPWCDFRRHLFTPIYVYIRVLRYIDVNYITCITILQIINLIINSLT